MTIHSMTGFAAAQGTTGAHSWSCELRSVNAKGLDLRLRIPEWLEGFEPFVRGELGKALARGNVSMTLRINRNEDAGADLTINEAMLATVLSSMAKIEAAAKVAGVDLAPSTSAEILSQRGVLEQGNTADDPAPIVAALKGAFAAILSDFVKMRASEGAALKAVLLDQLDEIDTLQSRAADLAEARKPQMAETLRTNLARVLDNADKVDEAR
ncbi:MAG: YicC/YloC family endoribonuclease, partial [Phaeobacter italicus]